jgi:hypothetical protein
MLPEQQEIIDQHMDLGWYNLTPDYTSVTKNR